jgi:thiol-disulfide isomerase/thioredoxin
MTTTVLAVCLGLLSCSLPASGGELSVVEPGPRAALSLPDLNGRLHDLNELRGKVVLVNFWASWCTPCIQEMPSIQRLADKMRNRPFAVIGVNVAEAERRVRTMVQRLGIGFPVLLDKDSAVFNRWKVTVLPTTYLLDADGVVRYVGRGPLEWDGVEISELLEALAEGQETAKE